VGDGIGTNEGKIFPKDDDGDDEGKVEGADDGKGVGNITFILLLRDDKYLCCSSTSSECIESQLKPAFVQSCFRLLRVVVRSKPDLTK
jgi:hypothetical protein